MVTCTAMAFAILQHSRQRNARQSSAEAKNVVREHVGQHQSPLPVFKVGHGFESVARESGEGAAKTDHHQQPPSRIYQCALRGPDDKEAYDEAAHDVDEES